MDNAAKSSAVAFSQKTLEVASDLGSLNQLPTPQAEQDVDMPFVVNMEENEFSSPSRHQHTKSVTLFDDRPSISSFADSTNTDGSNQDDGFDQIEFFSNVISYLYRRIQQEMRGP